MPSRDHKLIIHSDYNREELIQKLATFGFRVVPDKRDKAHPTEVAFEDLPQDLQDTIREKRTKEINQPCGKQGCDQPATNKILGSLTYHSCDDHEPEISALCKAEDRPTPDHPSGKTCTDPADITITPAMKIHTEQSIREQLANHDCPNAHNLLQSLARINPTYGLPFHEPLPNAHLDMQRRMITYCQADNDDDCTWAHCPQLRDNEPNKTNRHCPYDKTPFTGDHDDT